MNTSAARTAPDAVVQRSANSAGSLEAIGGDVRDEQQGTHLMRHVQSGIGRSNILFAQRERGRQQGAREHSKTSPGGRARQARSSS